MHYLPLFLLCSSLLISVGQPAGATEPPTSLSDFATEQLSAYSYPAAWLLQRDGDAPVIVDTAELTRLPQSPASTIKPLLALIGLQIGALESRNELLPWDQRRYPGRPEWQKAMALDEAMRSSSESYFRVLADRIGRDQLAEWVARVGYGNGQVGERADLAWHDSVLTVTAAQQLVFIDRLRRGSLPFDAAHLDAVKATLLVREAGAERLYGKTGTSLPNEGPGVGWWIGWVESSQGSASFVLQLQLTELDDRSERLALANQLLQHAGLLKVAP